jgi:hypothetical protein
MVQKRAQDINDLLPVGFLYSVDTLLSLNERTTNRKDVAGMHRATNPKRKENLCEEDIRRGSSLASFFHRFFCIVLVTFFKESCLRLFCNPVLY